MKNYLIYTLVFVLAVFSSCEKDEDYDISWPVPTIESVSSYNAELSATLTLTGNFTKVTKVYFGNIEGNNVQVASDEQSLTVEVPRKVSVDGTTIKVQNDYLQSFETTEVFVPIIPLTTVSDVSEIQVGLSFTITGANVDLLTEITVNGEVASVISASPSSILVSAAGLSLAPGQLAEVAFSSLAKNDVPSVANINVIYPFILYSEVILWDFEDGTHVYDGEPTASVENGTGMPDNGSKYFSLRAPGYGWDKATGNMSYGDVVDFSKLVNPYLTFAVRTPAGSKGYCQAQIPDAWRHFGYGFDTGGEWMIISEPLEANWEGAGWDPAKFDLTLGFKAGNAGDKQDIDIAFVKITEGPYDGSQQTGDVMGGSAKPAKVNVMDFEVASEWPNVLNGSEVVGSLDFRKDEIDAFIGNGFFTYVDDGTLGGWGGYWGQTISKDMSSVNLSLFEDPYLSFALNTIDAPQYIIVRMYQYDGQLAMVQKFFPNTNGKWQNFQFSLFNTDMENWSDASTDLGAHYKSLTKFVKGVPFDRIEVIVCRNDANNTVGVSIDDMVITDGARY